MDKLRKISPARNIVNKFRINVELYIITNREKVARRFLFESESIKRDLIFLSECETSETNTKLEFTVTATFFLPLRAIS